VVVIQFWFDVKVQVEEVLVLLSMIPLLRVLEDDVNAILL
jgi:hypothetical protein